MRNLFSTPLLNSKKEQKDLRFNNAIRIYTLVPPLKREGKTQLTLG